MRAATMSAADPNGGAQAQEPGLRGEGEPALPVLTGGHRLGQGGAGTPCRVGILRDPREELVLEPAVAAGCHEIVKFNADDISINQFIAMAVAGSRVVDLPGALPRAVTSISGSAGARVGVRPLAMELVARRYL
jgi:hypothetical protein